MSFFLGSEFLDLFISGTCVVMVKLKRFRTAVLVFGIVTLATFLLSYHFQATPLFLVHAFLSTSRPRPCACYGRCVTDAEHEPWLTERFNRSVYPLLTRDDNLLSRRTYDWWQRLQGDPRPANYSAVVEEMFRFFPGDALYTDAGPQRCRSCAVVGNSGNLKGSHYGKLIDANNLVIRVNRGPTQGFEKDVGARTTHRLIYPESAVDLDEDTSLVLVPYKTLDLQWVLSAFTTGTVVRTYVPVKPRIKANRDKVQIYSPTFMKYVYENWLNKHGRYPSTGFLSLIFALHICDEVNVFGFGADQHGNWHHYWGDNRLAGAFRHTGVHNGDYEYNVTLLLSEKHQITVF